jgi:hypothetical protein
VQELLPAHRDESVEEATHFDASMIP